MEIIGEEELIKLILKYLDKEEFGERLSPGDDARDIIPRSLRIMFAIDGYSIESAKLPWRSLRDVAFSVLTGSASDLVSKGAVPYGFMVSIGISKQWTKDMVIELYEGLREACKEYGCRLLGGDTNKSSDPWITVAGIGFSTAAHPPRRDGARPEDIIVVTGYYGAMGIVALDGIDIASKLNWVKEYTRRPRIYVHLANIIALYSKVVHASMDVSDGLSYTLYTMAHESNVCFSLNDLPVYHEELKEYCKGDQECILERVMYGGEEYGVVLAIDPKYVEKFTNELRNYGIPYKIVGKVVKCKEGEVYYHNKLLPIYRWDQFRGWTRL